MRSQPRPSSSPLNPPALPIKLEHNLNVIPRHRRIPHSLRRGILLDDLLDLALIRSLVLFKQIERVGLGGGIRVGFIEEGLDTEQDLLDVYRGLPAFFFVEDGEADGARGVDVWVEERGYEFACTDYMSATS